MIADVKLEGVWYGVFLYELPTTAFSAERVQRTVSVFLSQPIDATFDILGWNTLSWTATKPTGTDILVFVKSASTQSALDSRSEWAGPFLNQSGEDIKSESGRFIQVMIVLFTKYDTGTETLITPVLDEFRASCFVSAGQQTFYSKKFDLGFKPKNVLLTYNGTISDDSLIRFAIAGTDSDDPNEYQRITPNTVEELRDISKFSDGFKIMFGAIGSKKVPFEIDEIAVAVSGSGQTKINKT
jgi:hypothetical protein